jgi:molybdenum cofactor cytidylyltransferase
MIAAIVPACGSSRRMGRPKLTLPLGGVPQIERVIRGLMGGGVDRVLVVIPGPRHPGGAELAAVVAGAGGECTVADPVPAQMRQTVEHGLARLAEAEAKPAAIVLTPGDALGVTPGLVRALIDRISRGDADIVVATHEGRRGHPVLMSWRIAQRIPGLPHGLGINTLMCEPEWRVQYVSAADPAVIADLNTPEDCARWTQALGGDVLLNCANAANDSPSSRPPFSPSS